MTSNADKYFDLGFYQREVSTSSDAARLWFNRGLVWAYGFNHEEAIVCFEKSIAYDPGCVLAYWGLAYALGPNYNKPWDLFDAEELGTSVERAHRAVEEAEKATASALPVEKALVKALRSRYPQDKPAENASVWSQDYATAMTAVYHEFGDDLDVATIYIDALMNLTPWQLWDIRTGKPAPHARTNEVQAAFEQAFKQEAGLRHPGLLHMYIHFMELSPTPEAALPIADHLRNLVPDAGHLQHMPTHLDILCGRYEQAIVSNTAAVLADERFLARAGARNFYTLYRCHDYHFRIYAAMFAGKKGVALETAARLAETIPEDLLRVQSPPMADWLEGFLSMRVHVMVRFGMWEDLVALELPEDQGLYTTTTAMTCYGRGVALSALGRVEEAEMERSLFREALGRVQSTRTVFNNTCQDILRIAEAMLDGELEYRKGNYESAFAHLREAILRDDGLPYDEPWGWMQPTRHAYAALLLEQGHVEEALPVCRADLGLDDSLPRAQRHLNNVWALHGYHECLVRLGREEEAKKVLPQLNEAVALADVPIRSSCFCRRP